jgi:hypothetical protein
VFEVKTPDALPAYGLREIATTKRRPGKCAHEVNLILQLEPQMLMNKQEIPAAQNTAFFEQISSKKLYSDCGGCGRAGFSNVRCAVCRLRLGFRAGLIFA